MRLHRATASTRVGGYSTPVRNACAVPSGPNPGEAIAPEWPPARPRTHPWRTMLSSDKIAKGDIAVDRKSWSKPALIGMAVAGAALSQALTFNFTHDPSMDPNAVAAFATAGSMWSSIFSDPIT